MPLNTVNTPSGVPAKRNAQDGNTVIGTAAFEFSHYMVVDRRKAPSEQRFHYYGGYASAMKFVIKIFGIRVSRIQLFGMFPIEVVELYLREIPFDNPVVVHFKQVVEHLDFTVI